jgi:DnaJ-class molecular chaperone
MSKNYYEILGVQKDISPLDLKKRFRTLLISQHPDKHPDNPEIYQAFLLITEAYEVLSDPSKRQLYDVDKMESLVNMNYNDPIYWGGQVQSSFGGTRLDEAFNLPGSLTDIYDDFNQAEDLFLKRKYEK